MDHSSHTHTHTHSVHAVSNDVPVFLCPLQVLPFQVPYNASEVHVVVVNRNLSANQGSMMASLTWSDLGPCSDDCNFTLVFNLSAVSIGNHCTSTWELAPK